MARITVELAEDIAGHPDPGALTHYQASQLLGFSRFEFEDFLIARNTFDHAYGIEDLESDLATLDQLRAQGFLER